MKNINAFFNVSLLSINHYLNDPDTNLEDQYTILKYSRRNNNEIAEITSALRTKYIADVVPIKLRRVALYETIVKIQTEIKLENDMQLRSAFAEIYQKHIIPELKKKSENGKTIEQELNQRIENQISVLLDKCFAIYKDELDEKKSITRNHISYKEQEILELISNIDKQVTQNIENNLYTPGSFNSGETKESIIQKIVKDKLYKKEVQREIEKIIHPIIDQILEDRRVYLPFGDRGQQQPLERLESVESNLRQTFMMVGAPASGKSTSYALMAVDAMGKGIYLRDIIKCNTDSYRPLLSSPKELGENTIQHASFNYDESYLITKRIYQTIRNKLAKENVAPQLLIDCVYPTQEKINIGIMKGGHLNLYCISVPAEISVQRAYQRGVETGRYIDTKSLLMSHRDISANFHDVLKNNSGANIRYLLLDNNVARNELPNLIERGNLQDRIIIIHDLNKLIEFISKKDIILHKKEVGERKTQVDRIYEVITILNELEKAGLKTDFSKVEDKQLIMRKQNESSALRMRKFFKAQMIPEYALPKKNESKNESKTRKTCLNIER